MVKWNGISLVGCESQQHKNIFHKLENDCCCCCCWPNCCVFHQTEYEQASERANERPKTNFNKIQCKLRQKHYVVHVNFVYVILYAWRRPLYLFIYLFPHTHTHKRIRYYCFWSVQKCSMSISISVPFLLLDAKNHIFPSRRQWQHHCYCRCWCWVSRDLFFHQQMRKRKRKTEFDLPLFVRWNMH